MTIIVGAQICNKKVVAPEKRNLNFGANSRRNRCLSIWLRLYTNKNVRCKNKLKTLFSSWHNCERVKWAAKKQWNRLWMICLKSTWINNSWFTPLSKTSIDKSSHKWCAIQIKPINAPQIGIFCRDATLGLSPKCAIKVAHKKFEVCEKTERSFSQNKRQ